MDKEQIYLCRASGEGSHQFKLCEDEAAVMAFYAEMFGPDYDGKYNLTLAHFRDPDNWSNEGTAYSYELYMATWEVWIVQRSDLALTHADARQEGYREGVEEAQRLRELINTPEIEDFLQGVRLESAHQIERWGSAHDREKSAENWYWLIGYLGGKALRSAINGDREKALHHCISSAAALMNWHAAIRTDESGAGIGKDEDIAPDGSKITPTVALTQARGETNAAPQVPRPRFRWGPGGMVAHYEGGWEWHGNDDAIAAFVSPAAPTPAELKGEGK